MRIGRSPLNPPGVKLSGTMPTVALGATSGRSVTPGQIPATASPGTSAGLIACSTAGTPNSAAATAPAPCSAPYTTRSGSQRAIHRRVPSRVDRLTSVNNATAWSIPKSFGSGAAACGPVGA